jgi:hypothetical protein
MSTRLKKITRPDVNFEAMLGVVGILLGFLFVVVIYLLENPTEIASMWGPILLIYLTICYIAGLSFIGSVLAFEINYHLANTLYESKKPDTRPKYESLRVKIKKSLQNSVLLLALFVYMLGFFLVSLAGFSLSKFYYPFFSVLNGVISSMVGESQMVLVYLVVMFLFQLILIVPFSRYFGELYDSYKAVIMAEES